MSTCEDPDEGDDKEGSAAINTENCRLREYNRHIILQNEICRYERVNRFRCVNSGHPSTVETESSFSAQVNFLEAKVLQFRRRVLVLSVDELTK